MSTTKDYTVNSKAHWEYEPVSLQVGPSDDMAIAHALRPYTEEGWRVVSMWVNPRTVWMMALLERPSTNTD